MTKEITKAIILQAIQDKFKLREFDPALFLFDETVVPVYDIAPHLISSTTVHVQKAITAADAVHFFSVPENEIWKLQSYNVIFMGAGAFTVTGVYLRRAGLTDVLYLDMTAGQSVSYSVNLPQPLKLYSGDTLYVLIDSYTSTQNLRLYIDVEKEEIR